MKSVPEFKVGLAKPQSWRAKKILAADFVVAVSCEANLTPTPFSLLLLQT
jgi:hypothetical protein